MELVYIGADHRGYQLKESIKNWLSNEGYVVNDTGNSEYNKDDDYPDFAIGLGEVVARNGGKGILICGSGVGMVAAANKVKGIRAGLCSSSREAYNGRNDDDMNVLCLSANLVDEATNQEIVRIFLETPFGSEERYIRRINKIRDYESKNCI